MLRTFGHPVEICCVRLASPFNTCRNIMQQLNEGVVSKETEVLRRWGSSIQKFGFINGVDNVNLHYQLR